MSSQSTIVTYLLVTLAAMGLGAAPGEFQTHAIADVTQASQVFPIDVNHDGKIDLAAWDTDGDGVPEIVLSHEFSARPKESRGIISLLKHSADLREPWTMTEIDRLPATHRFRLADIDGSGKKVLVSSPLAAADTEPPDYRGNLPLVIYRPGEWKRQLVDDSNEGVVHGIFPTAWDQSGREGVRIAGFAGVRLYNLGKDGDRTHTEIVKGDPAPWPKSGASEVAVGHLGKERFLVTVEPWHGNQIVVYRQQNSAWQRNVIDDSLPYAHTILTVDFNGERRDEIVAGCREKLVRVYLYDFDGKRWNRRTLDDGMAANSCAAADLNGDGKPDIVCVGTATNNLKWYENLGPAKSARR